VHRFLRIMNDIGITVSRLTKVSLQGSISKTTGEKNGIDWSRC
jgi:hypothetical protein